MTSPNNSPSKKQALSSMAVPGAPSTMILEQKFMDTKVEKFLSQPFVLNQEALYVCQLLAINTEDLVLRWVVT